MALTEAQVRGAWEWYMAEPDRSWRDAAGRCGLSDETLRQAAQRLGLSSKPRHRAQKAHRAVGVMTYGRILADYRAGGEVEAIAAVYGLAPDAVLGILRDAGEVCARCQILLARNDGYGVAVLTTGRRVCQECVEETGARVERWEAPPLVREVAAVA